MIVEDRKEDENFPTEQIMAKVTKGKTHCLCYLLLISFFIIFN